MRVIHSDSPMHQGWLQELRGKLQGDLKGRSEDELATWMSQMSGLSSERRWGLAGWLDLWSTRVVSVKLYQFKAF